MRGQVKPPEREIMNSRQWTMVALCAAGCAAAQADVTVTTTTSGKASFINVGGEGHNYIKGNRMRTDTSMAGRAMSLIVDIDGRRFIDVNDAKKSATVTPLESIA